MSLFTRLCHFVDWDLGRSGGVRMGAWSLLMAAAPTVALAAGARLLTVEPSYLAISIAIAATASWVAFVAWRGWRLLKAYAIKGDRDYDRLGKLKLSLEHRSSESVTAARRKRKRH